MDRFSFVFTILFMLLGPLKTLGPFAQLMKGADEAYVRAVSVRATLIASVLVAFVALAGGSLPAKYGISMQALTIAGGLVLLISALRNMFPEPDAPHPERGDAKPMQLAVSPVALPIIVPPAGVAALLIFAMMQARFPGILRAIGISLAIIMALNFLVMILQSRDRARRPTDAGAEAARRGAGVHPGRARGRHDPPGPERTRRRWEPARQS